MTMAGAVPRRYGTRRTAAAEFTVWIAGSYSDGPGFDSLAPHQSGLKGLDGGPDERGAQQRNGAPRCHRDMGHREEIPMWE